MFLQATLILSVVISSANCMADEYSHTNQAQYGATKDGGYQYGDKGGSYGHKQQGYGSDRVNGKKGSTVKGGRYYYGGKYTGKCGPDGLYYRDDYSFVLCSNAKGYVQPCAPGTRNSGYTDYAPGYYYGYSDFCDVNLVDYGYSAPKYGPGYAEKPAYGFAAYRYPAGSGHHGNSPKSLSGHQHNAYNRYEGQGRAYSGQADSYAARQGYDQLNRGSAYSGSPDAYETRNNYHYKDIAH